VSLPPVGLIEKIDAMEPSLMLGPVVSGQRLAQRLGEIRGVSRGSTRVPCQTGYMTIGR